MRILFSKDRPAQLDLLMRSLRENAPVEDTKVIWTATDDRYREQYERKIFSSETLVDEFNDRLRLLLNAENNRWKDATVTFFCDDDVMYRRDWGHAQLLTWNPLLLCFSLRLGMENTQDKPRGFPLWDWTSLPPTDFGFPGSIDGHTFRVADVLDMLGGDYIENPTQLETILAHRVSMFTGTRWMMACYPLQRVVGVPVNRVSDDSGVEFGLAHPQPVEQLHDMYSSGLRIDLGKLDFSGVTGCHQEIRYEWSKT